MRVQIATAAPRDPHTHKLPQTTTDRGSDSGARTKRPTTKNAYPMTVQILMPASMEFPFSCASRFDVGGFPLGEKVAVVSFGIEAMRSGSLCPCLLLQ